MEYNVIACELFNRREERRDLTIEFKDLNGAEADPGTEEARLVYLSWTMNVPIRPYGIDASPETTEFSDDIKEAFAPEFCKESGKFPRVLSPITIKLEVDPQDGSDARLLVYGDLLATVALHFGSSVRFRLAFTLLNHKVSNGNMGIDLTSYSHQSKDLDVNYGKLPAMAEVNEVLTGFCLQSFYAFADDISKLWEDGWANPWKINVVGTLVAFQEKEDERFEKLLKSKHNDLTLVASDGQEIPASKMFLEASSKVLEKALEHGCEQECENHRLEMKAESGEAIEAFLEFIYVKSYDKAEANSSIAVEVLEMAHKYDVATLEKAMIQMFRKKQKSWIGFENAVKLFRFVRNVEGEDYKDLKMRAVRLINKSKSKDFRDSAERKNLFKEDYLAADELSNLMHEMNNA